MPDDDKMAVEPAGDGKVWQNIWLLRAALSTLLLMGVVLAAAWLCGVLHCACIADPRGRGETEVKGDIDGPCACVCENRRKMTSPS